MGRNLVLFAALLLCAACSHTMKVGIDAHGQAPPPGTRYQFVRAAQGDASVREKDLDLLVLRTCAGEAQKRGFRVVGESADCPDCVIIRTGASTDNGKTIQGNPTKTCGLGPDNRSVVCTYQTNNVVVFRKEIVLSFVPAQPNPNIDYLTTVTLLNGNPSFSGATATLLCRVAFDVYPFTADRSVRKVEVQGSD
jgi:hypothetical protein